MILNARLNYFVCRHLYTFFLIIITQTKRLFLKTVIILLNYQFYMGNSTFVRLLLSVDETKCVNDYIIHVVLSGKGKGPIGGQNGR